MLRGKRRVRSGGPRRADSGSFPRTPDRPFPRSSPNALLFAYSNPELPSKRPLAEFPTQKAAFLEGLTLVLDFFTFFL